MRRSTIFLLITACNLILCIFLALHAHSSQATGQAERLVRVRLVKELRLTDLCLFTEARYTRHPAMSDLHSPFQDHPGALEHFPSGSLVSPPASMTRFHAQSP
jgi:hypothetical protein